MPDGLAQYTSEIVALDRFSHSISHMDSQSQWNMFPRRSLFIRHEIKKITTNSTNKNKIICDCNIVVSQLFSMSGCLGNVDCMCTFVNSELKNSQFNQRA